MKNKISIKSKDKNQEKCTNVLDYLVITIHSYNMCETPALLRPESNLSININTHPHIHTPTHPSPRLARTKKEKKRRREEEKSKSKQSPIPDDPNSSLSPLHEILQKEEEEEEEEKSINTIQCKEQTQICKDHQWIRDTLHLRFSDSQPFGRK